MTDDQEPTVGRKGRAYVSLLDGNLHVNIFDQNLFDLTEQDGRDAIDALRQVFPDKPAAAWAPDLAYTWFVAYSHPAGHGSTEIGTSHPVDGFDSIVKFAEMIEGRYKMTPGSVVILNFQLLNGPA